MQKFRKAELAAYITWLQGFMTRGGRLTHYYDYPWQQWTWLVAVNDFRLGGECGTDAVNIIVPSSVRWLGGDVGHCNLYFMAGFEHTGISVPIFINPEFIAELDHETVLRFIGKEKRKDRLNEQYMEKLRADYQAGLQDSDLAAFVRSREMWGIG